MEWRDQEIGAIRRMMSGMRPAEGAPEPGYPDRRKQMEAFASLAPLPDLCHFGPVELAGRPAERLHPLNAPKGAAIVYLHGGGYCLGSPLSHRAMIARLAVAASREAVVIDYPLAPEHPFPAAVDHALAAWKALLAEGLDPKRALFAGDSAGGGLTFALALAAKQAGAPLPGGLLAISPWVDLKQTGRAYEPEAVDDPMITKAGLDAYARDYLSGSDPDHPLASPLHGDLADLPPTLIQVGSQEGLLTDATAMTEALGLANVDVTLRIWPEMIHVWHFFAPQLAAGRAATTEAGEWIKARTA